MFKRPWKFFENSFLTASDGNFTLFLSMSYFHYNRLLKAKDTNAFAMLLFTAYAPLHAAYVLAYNKWHAQQGTQTSSTGALRDKLFELQHTLAKKWDKEVQKIYDEDTNEYKALFPHHRVPFMTGGQNDRISAVGTLIEQMENFPLLDTIRTTLVEPFYTSLLAADAAKDGNIGGTGSLSAAVEAARVAGAWAMYGNLGLAMNEYRTDWAQIDNFFPVKMVRDHEQLDFMGHVAPLTTVNIAQRTLKPEQIMKLMNPGIQQLKYFAATTKDQQSPVTPVAVDPGQTVEISAVEFGNSKDAPFINVRNDGNVSGEFEISLG